MVGSSSFTWECNQVFSCIRTEVDLLLQLHTLEPGDRLRSRPPRIWLGLPTSDLLNVVAMFLPSIQLREVQHRLASG